MQLVASQRPPPADSVISSHTPSSTLYLITTHVNSRSSTAAVNLPAHPRRPASSTEIQSHSFQESQGSVRVCVSDKQAGSGHGHAGNETTSGRTRLSEYWAGVGHSAIAGQWTQHRCGWAEDCQLRATNTVLCRCTSKSGTSRRTNTGNARDVTDVYVRRRRTSRHQRSADERYRDWWYQWWRHDDDRCAQLVVTVWPGGRRLWRQWRLHWQTTHSVYGRQSTASLQSSSVAAEEIFVDCEETSARRRARVRRVLLLDWLLASQHYTYTRQTDNSTRLIHFVLVVLPIDIKHLCTLFTPYVFPFYSIASQQVNYSVLSESSTTTGIDRVVSRCEVVCLSERMSRHHYDQLYSPSGRQIQRNEYRKVSNE